MQYDEDGGLPAVPGRVLAILAVALAALVGLLVILEQVGGDGEVGVLLATAFLALAILGVGTMGRASQRDSFLYAGRRIRGRYAGLALAAALMPGAGFVAYASSLQVDGFDSLWLPGGWLAGAVMLGALIAPAYRKSGACSLADAFSCRFGGHAARLSAAFVALGVGFCLFFSALKAAAAMAALFLGGSVDLAIAVIFGLILVPVLFGGIRSVMWVQIGLGGALLAGVLVPALAALVIALGAPLPQLALGDLFSALAVDATAPAVSSLSAPPLTTLSPTLFAGLALCLAMGTAATPHLIMPFGALTSVSSARRTSGYAIVAAGILLTAIPAVVALVDVAVASQTSGIPIVDWPPWLFGLSGDGLATICGAAAGDPSAAQAACGSAVVATTEIAVAAPALGEAAIRIIGLPRALSGLVVIGVLAGSLAVALGSLFGLGVTLGRDVIQMTVAPRLSPYRQLVLNRICVIAIAVGAAALVPYVSYDPARLVATGLAISGGALFVPLVLTFWWPRTTELAVAAGILSALASMAGYVIAVDYGVIAPVFGLGEARAALIGAPVALIVTVGLSLLDRRPRDRIRLAGLHVPGETR